MGYILKCSQNEIRKKRACVMSYTCTRVHPCVIRYTLLIRKPLIYKEAYINVKVMLKLGINYKYSK